MACTRNTSTGSIRKVSKSDTVFVIVCDGSDLLSYSELAGGGKVPTCFTTERRAFNYAIENAWHATHPETRALDTWRFDFIMLDGDVVRVAPDEELELAA